MTDPQPPHPLIDIAEVVNTVRGRASVEVSGRPTSMEIIWIIAELENRYGVGIPLDERMLDTVLSAPDVVIAFHEILDTQLRKQS